MLSSVHWQPHPGTNMKFSAKSIWIIAVFEFSSVASCFILLYASNCLFLTYQWKINWPKTDFNFFHKSSNLPDFNFFFQLVIFIVFPMKPFNNKFQFLCRNHIKKLMIKFFFTKSQLDDIQVLFFILQTQSFTRWSLCKGKISRIFEWSFSNMRSYYYGKCSCIHFSALLMIILQTQSFTSWSLCKGKIFGIFEWSFFNMRSHYYGKYSCIHFSALLMIILLPLGKGC